MTTAMHRLQISLPPEQARRLSGRAKQLGVSMAEVVRRLVEREIEASPEQGDVDALWEIAGIADDPAPLLEGVAVSERPDLYLAGLSAPAETSSTPPKPRAKRSRRR